MQKVESQTGNPQKRGLQKQTSDPKVTYDDLLTSAGEFGLYQTVLFFGTMPFYFFGTVSYLNQLFITETSPNHWCKIPELMNLTELQRRTLAIPPDETAKYGYSMCTAYVAKWKDVLASGSLTSNPKWSTEPCRDGWEFNKTEIPYETITSQFGWMCDRDSYQATAQSIFFSGSIVGGFLFGRISDRFGRLPAAATCNVIGGVAGIVSIFAKDFLEFAICRFFMGMSWDNSMMMVYLLVLECVAPKYRTVLANLPFALFYTLSACALPYIALACNDWKIFSLATCIPMIFAIVAPFIMPESPRWLLSAGRVDDAIKKIQRIGQVNKKNVPSELIEQYKIGLSKQTEELNYGVLNILKKAKLRNMFVCECIGYMCCVITYDALIRLSGQLDFDFFLSFAVMSFTEFPSLFLISFTLDLTGRKWLSVLTFAVASVFCILTLLLGGGWSAVLCAVIARFSINMTLNALLQWSTEMLPTAVRGTGMSIVHIMGYVATMISPFIVYLDYYYAWLPLVIISAVAGFGALIILGLPETARKEMPQTFEDAEALLKNARFFEIPCLMK